MQNTKQTIIEKITNEAHENIPVFNSIFDIHLLKKEMVDPDVFFEDLKLC